MDWNQTLKSLYLPPPFPEEGGERGWGRGRGRGLCALCPRVPAARSSCENRWRQRGSPRGLHARCAPRSRLRRRSRAPGCPVSHQAAGNQLPHTSYQVGGRTPICLGIGGNRKPVPPTTHPSPKACLGLLLPKTPSLGFQPGLIWEADPCPDAPRPRPPPRRRRISMSDASGPGITRRPRLTAS